MKLVLASVFLFYFVLKPPTANAQTTPELIPPERGNQTFNLSAENIGEDEDSVSGWTREDEERLIRQCRSIDRNSTGSYVLYTEHPVRYWSNIIKYRIQNYTPDLKHCEVRNILKKAFRAWEEAGEVNFVEAAKNELADMRIKFASGDHGDGSGFPNWILGHGFPGGDLHLNEAERWWSEDNVVNHTSFDDYGVESDCVFPFVFNGKQYNSCTIDGSTENKYWCSTTANYDTDGKKGVCKNVHSLFHIVVHEVGHALGFHHSHNCLSIMYHTHTRVKKPILHKVDIQGMEDVYGARTSPLPPLQLESCGEHETESEDKEEKETGSKREFTKSKIRTSEDICILKNYKAQLPFHDHIRILINESYVWRRDEKLGLQSRRYPIKNLFKNGPEQVDAAYVRGKLLLLFRGKQYWTYWLTFSNVFPKSVLPYLSGGRTHPLTNLGFPANVTKVDGAINWKRPRKSESKNKNKNRNKWTTFFVGNEFYSLNERSRKMVKGNPEEIELWNNDFGVITKAMDHPTHYRKSILFDGDKAIIMKNNYQKHVKRSLDEIVNC